MLPTVSIMKIIPGHVAPMSFKYVLICSDISRVGTTISDCGDLTSGRYFSNINVQKTSVLPVPDFALIIISTNKNDYYIAHLFNITHFQNVLPSPQHPSGIARS